MSGTGPAHPDGTPAPAGAPVLGIDVHARVGDFALRAAFTVGAGLTVVFGPSGAGKTRLLRLVAGLDTPTDGRIHLDDTVFTDRAAGIHLPVHRRGIGMVSQEPYLLPHRTSVANVALAVRHADRAVRRRVALDWLDRVGAAAYSERRPGQLSGGQRQRVALARALAGAPGLLLLDEPFSALEVPVRRQLRALVRRIVDEAGVPTLFVTHDPEELAALADRVLLADHGELVTVTGVADAIAGHAADGDTPAQ